MAHEPLLRKPGAVRNSVGGQSAWLSAVHSAHALLEALRPRQWVKNLFILAPFFFAHKWSPAEAVRATVAVAVFCVASAAAYLWNDWWDREADRQHPQKRLRPLASGALSSRFALAAMILLVVVSLLCSYLSATSLFRVVISYLGLQFLYSTLLKRLVILDVMAVAAGFVLRVQAGGAAAQVEISNWLLATTSLLALFLGFSKRRQELAQLSPNSARVRAVLADYNLAFIDQMNGALAGSCIVCYALYTVAPETIQRFGTSNLILTLPFVVYGILRYLHLIYYQHLGDDPTEVFLRDRPLQLCVALWLAALVWVIRGW